MKKLFFIISYLGLAVGMALITVLTIWSIYPYKTIEVNSLTVNQETVEKGGVLTYKIDYCKYIDKPARLQKSFVNDITFPYTFSMGNNALGCRVTSVSQVVPEELPSGEYSLKLTFTYEVNPIREMTVSVLTNKFKVI